MLRLKNQLQHLHLLCTARKTYRELQNSAWTRSSKEIVSNGHKNVNWRYDFQTFITGYHIWNDTTFSNNVRTISITLASIGQTTLYLPPLFFVGGSVLAGTSRNVRNKSDSYFWLISRLFFKRISVTPKLSSIRPGAESNVTLSFSRKRGRTGPLTLNTSNLLSKNSIRRELRKNSNLFGNSAKISNR